MKAEKFVRGLFVCVLVLLFYSILLIGLGFVNHDTSSVFGRGLVPKHLFKSQ